MENWDPIIDAGMETVFSGKWLFGEKETQASAMVGVRVKDGQKFCAQKYECEPEDIDQLKGTIISALAVKIYDLEEREKKRLQATG
jgi:hypothetical protein